MLSLKRRLPSCSAPASNVGAARSLGGRLSAFAISLVLETVAGRAQAQQTSAWQGTTSDYNTAANWNPAAVPDNNVQGAATQAEFGATGLGTVNLSAAVTTNNWVFDANAQAYTITGDQLEFAGNGITSSAATNQSIANAIAGTGGLTQGGTGTLLLSGTNTYTGATMITAGTLQAGSSFSFSRTSPFTVNGTLDLNGYDNYLSSLAGSAAGNVIVSGNETGLIVGSDNTSTTFAGTISGATGQLEKVGTGTLTLSGNNTYGSSTVIDAGTLMITGTTASFIVGAGDGATLATGAANALTAAPTVNLLNNATFSLNGFSQTIDSLNSTGTGAQVLLGGTVGGGTALTLAGTVGAFSGTISGAGAIIVSQFGNATFSGANTYQGGTTLGNNAAFTVASSTAFGTGAVQVGTNATIAFDTAAGYSLANNILISNQAIFNVAAGPVQSVTGIISDAAGAANPSLLKQGAGTLLLSGANTYSGGTTIAGGTIQVGVDPVGTPGAIVSSAIGTGTLTLDAGTLQAGGAYTIANAVALNAGGGTIDSNGNVFTLSGTIANGDATTGVLTIVDSAAANGVVVVAGAGAYSGATLVQSGTLRAGAANAFSAASDYTVTGTLDLDNFSNTIGSLSGSGQVMLGSGTLTVGDGVATTFSGSIGGTGGLIKGGEDQLVLSGTNTYTGATTINGGSITAGANNAFSAASATTINSNGSFDLGGFAETVNTVLLDGGLLSNGALTGAVTSTGGVIASITGPASVTLTGGTTQFNAGNGYTGVTDIQGGAATAGVANAYSAASATSVAAGGTLDLGGFAQQINAVAVNGGTLQNGALTGAVTSTGGAIADIAGPATVAVTSGTTVFVDANSYTGATTITGGATTASNANAYSAASATSVAAGGTLDLGGFAQTLLSLSGNGAVTNNGSTNATLSIADTLPNSATFSGTISDGRSNTTALAITEGTQYLTGANTYTGGTAIGAQGALAIGNGGMSGSIVGNVANDGILAFDRSDSVTFAGQISGAGAVYQLGTGTTVLTGDSTFTGGTAIAAGSLQLGNGSTTGSVQGNIQNQGTLIFDRADTYTFANVVSGAGNVVQGGSGTTVLTGANTYTGDTTVAAGTLSVDGSIVSPTIIGSGGTLNGTGSVGDVTVSNSGTLGAGTSAAIGVLSINGNVTFEQGSTYAVRIVSANQNDIVLAAGQANLAGGTVQALASGSGFAADTRYLILNAREGIATPFAGVTTNFAFLKPTLIYDANDVFLDVGNPLFTSLTNTTPAEAAVAQALQSGYAAGATGAGATLLNDIAGLSSAQAPAALAQLSGQATSATQEVSFAAGKLFMEALNDQSQHWLRGDKGGATTNEIVLEAKPLPYASSLAAQVNAAFLALDGAEVVPATRTWRAWGTGYTGGQTLKGLDGGTLDLSHRTSGGGFGADYQVNPSLLVGFGLGGSTSSFDVAQSLTSGRLDGAHAGVYAAGKFADFYTTAALTYAHFENTTNRLVTNVGPVASEQGRFGSDQVGGSFEAGYRKDMGHYAITPFASIAYFDTFQNGYSETGENANLYGLTFGAHNASSVPITVGAQIDGRFDVGNGWLLEPYLRASYDHQTIRQRQVDAFFTNVPLSFFTANGIVADEDVADVKLGGRLIVSPRTSLYASLEGVASSRTRGYAAMFGINVLNDDITSATANPDINSVAPTPWTGSVTPDLRIDSFRGSRGFPTSSSLAGGSGSQVYASTVVQASGTILPDTRLDLLAKPGFIASRQNTIGLSGSVATPADTTASATFTYLAINGVQPFFSLNFNLPSGRTVLFGTAANARLDPDFVSAGTFGQGLNIGPTIGVNLPFNEQLTGSLSAGYTHQGSYNKEAAIDPTTFSQGTQVFQPGSDLTFSANIGYVAAPFNTQASLSYAKESITFTDGTPTYQAGDRFIGSLTEAYTWNPMSVTTFTGTLSYSERNNTLDTTLPAFLAEAFDSNNFVARLRLDHTFTTDKWTYGPVLGFVYRNRNGYDETTAQFVPGKTIVSGGANVGYAFNEKVSAKASLEYFQATEANNPATNVGTVRTNGFRTGLTATFAF